MLIREREGGAEVVGERTRHRTSTAEWENGGDGGNTVLQEFTGKEVLFLLVGSKAGCSEKP